MGTKSTDQPRRRKRGFERADGLLSGQVARASEGRGFAVSRLLTHWEEVAGPDLAKSTRPVRVSYGKAALGATLTLLVRGATAPMIQSELPKLLERVNACYGYAAVARIKLTQTAPTGFADGQVDFQHRAGPEGPPEPTEHAREAARAAARDITDPDLRLALSRMGAHIIDADSDRKV